VILEVFFLVLNKPFAFRGLSKFALS